MKITHTLRSALALLIATVLLAACDIETFDEAASGFIESVPPPPPPPPPSPPPSPPPAGFGPNFSEIQANVFTPTCATAGCHSGAAPSAGLNLDDANSFAMLVGIASSQDAGILRVAASDPNNSYLIQKLEGTAGTGQQMPLGAAALPQSEIDIIRQWITDGAIDDRVQILAPIRVTSLSPGPNAALTTAPAQIVAGFDRDLDTATVNANTFILQASGNDGTFADGNETQIIAAAISVPATNQRSAVFDLTGVNLVDDTYRIRLLGAGGSFIMDLDANALDGEFGGVFPSGNGVAGGNFQATFSISAPVVLGPTLDQIQAVVFTPTCASTACHGGNNPPAGLSLSNADTSFAELVGVASSQNAAILRVAVNDPDNSYLIQKLEGVASNGGVMPPSGGLDPAVIAEIRQWITDGALR